MVGQQGDIQNLLSQLIEMLGGTQGLGRSGGTQGASNPMAGFVTPQGQNQGPQNQAPTQSPLNPSAPSPLQQPQSLQPNPLVAGARASIHPTGVQPNFVAGL